MNSQVKTRTAHMRGKGRSMRLDPPTPAGADILSLELNPKTRTAVITYVMKGVK
ncbi:hypothetical protein [Rhizobacter sp. Root404]|uniref:hypothetical protein n=1 Tax=Rhizobacter sp. Root404 TaxID=1736528 RepID=UPI000A412CAE|nr:hypothetical protein [Rhizobacter sp. Root404]